MNKAWWVARGIARLTFNRPQARNALFINIRARHFMPGSREARAGHQTNIAATHHGETQEWLPLFEP